MEVHITVYTIDIKQARDSEPCWYVYKKMW